MPKSFAMFMTKTRMKESKASTVQPRLLAKTALRRVGVSARQVTHVSSSPGAIIPPSRGGSRWPRTIRIRQDASVTTAEPAIAVARDQVIDRVADHPWDEVEDPCQPPARKLARNAEHDFGFYIDLTVRDEGKGILAIR